MNLAHYAFSDRIFLLVLSQYIALVIGGPRFFHTIIGYELPAHLWRVAILGAEKRLNRLNRPPADRKARGRLVVWGGSALLLAIGGWFVILTNQSRYGWYAELAVLAYLIPLRAVISPDMEILSAFRQKRFAAISPLLEPLTDRDVARLDGYGLIRGETVSHTARALPRYIITPAFWYLVGGMPLLLVCRFVGICADRFPLTHPRTRAFGAPAHFWDGLFQAVPTRLAILLMWPALAFVPSASLLEARQAWGRFPAEPKVSAANLPLRLAAYGLRLSLGGPS